MNQQDNAAKSTEQNPYTQCDHPARTCVRKDATDGSIRHYMQCDQCGGLGGAIKSNDPRIASAVPYREISEQRWRAKKLEFDKQRETERAEWRARYEEHLSSEEWAWRRRKVIEREGGLCQGCRAVKGTEVHHQTYARLGRELLTDLILLCHNCHHVIAHEREPAND